MPSATASTKESRRFQYVLNPTAVSVYALRFDTSKLPNAGTRLQNYKEKTIYANKKNKKYVQLLAHIKKKTNFKSSATSPYHHLIFTLSSPLKHLWEICQKLSHNGVARRALRVMASLKLFYYVFAGLSPAAESALLALINLMYSTHSCVLLAKLQKVFDICILFKWKIKNYELRERGG